MLAVRSNTTAPMPELIFKDLSGMHYNHFLSIIDSALVGRSGFGRT